MAVEVCNATAIPGKAGKYISMANGLMVESAPKMRIIRIRFRLDVRERRFIEGLLLERCVERNFGPDQIHGDGAECDQEHDEKTECNHHAFLTFGLACR